jgi:hypothetical protein
MSANVQSFGIHSDNVGLALRGMYFFAASKAVTSSEAQTGSFSS